MSPRAPANEEDLPDFETTCAAGQICRIADAMSPGHWRVRLRTGRALPGRGRMLHRQAPRPAVGGGFQQTSHTGPDMKINLGVTSIRGITLGDGKGQGERAKIRRSVRRRQCVARA
jgi:hypothetical protein